MILPITLTIAGAAALLAIWLGWRVGQLRLSEKVSVGDGGNERLLRRMRAQANFTEYTPFVLILIGAIELGAGTSWWLWLVGGVYILGRIAHAIGMDGAGTLRQIGIWITMLTLLGLALYAIAIPYTRIGMVAPIETIEVGDPLEPAIP